MIDRLKVSRVVNADLPSCYALVEDVQNYGSWVNDIREVSVEERDSQDRVTQATFRVAAMGRSATYSLLYDYSESPSTIHWQLAAGDIIKQLDGSYKFETLVDSIFEAAIERDPRKNQTTICGSIASSTASSPAQSDFFATNFNLE